MVQIYSNTQEKTVCNLLDTRLQNHGFNIVKLSIVNSRQSRCCEILIERIDENPITVFDCESVSELVTSLIKSKVLSLHDYSIQISSPGIERPLTRNTDFVKFIDSLVKLKTIYRINNRRNFSSIGNKKKQ